MNDPQPPGLRRVASIPIWPLLALALVLIASLGWGLMLRSDRNHTEEELVALQSEVDMLRQQANATAYLLLPTIDAPTNASGTAFFSLNGSGVISVVNLTPPAQGRNYQVWFYPSPEAEPVPGAILTVDGEGTGFMLIPADVGLFSDVAITLEPEAGSTTPSGPIVLSGSTGGARG